VWTFHHCVDTTKSGIAKQGILALLENAKKQHSQPRFSSVQIIANTASFSLYLKLGFNPSHVLANIYGFLAKGDFKLFLQVGTNFCKFPLYFYRGHTKIIM